MNFLGIHPKPLGGPLLNLYPLPYKEARCAPVFSYKAHQPLPFSRIYCQELKRSLMHLFFSFYAYPFEIILLICFSQSSLLGLCFLIDHFVFLGFLDVNECLAGSDLCHSNANCTNTKGSYNCTCHHGYRGDGYNCTGECLYFVIFMSSI